MQSNSGTLMNSKNNTISLETYFQDFRKNIVGINQEFMSPDGKKQIIYTDGTASGRLYRPLGERVLSELGACVA